LTLNKRIAVGRADICSQGHTSAFHFSSVEFSGAAIMLVQTFKKTAHFSEVVKTTARSQFNGVI